MKIIISFRFMILHGNVTIHFRNQESVLFDYQNVLAYTIDEKSETSTRGQNCECVDGLMATSAVEHHMTFSCPSSRSGSISVNINYPCDISNFNIDICDLE